MYPTQCSKYCTPLSKTLGEQGHSPPVRKKPLWGTRGGQGLRSHWGAGGFKPPFGAFHPPLPLDLLQPSPHPLTPIPCPAPTLPLLFPQQPPLLSPPLHTHLPPSLPPHTPPSTHTALHIHLPPHKREGGVSRDGARGEERGAERGQGERGSRERKGAGSNRKTHLSCWATAGTWPNAVAQDAPKSAQDHARRPAERCARCARARDTSLRSPSSSVRPGACTQPPVHKRQLSCMWLHGGGKGHT